VTRSYNLPPFFCGVCGKVHDGHSAQPACANQTFGWKTWLESMGVTWPEGSSVAHLAAIGKLRVTNLLPNLSLIEEVLKDLNDSSRQISVEVAVASFRLRDVEKLMVGGDVSCERLMALRKKGKANLVSTACVITKTGQEAIAKSVHEVPFPFEKTRTAFVNTNVVTAVEEKTHLNRFTTQEVGMILQVVPTTWANGESIDLLLNPQWLTLNRREKYPAVLVDRWHSSAEPLRQPVFESMSFQTQVTVRNGETILLGGSSTPDGERVYYGFLTVTLVDVQSTSQPK